MRKMGLNEGLNTGAKKRGTSYMIKQSEQKQQQKFEKLK